MIDVTVNGALRRIGERETIADLLVQMGLTGKRVAVERNGEIVPKSRHSEAGIVDGDRIEIVVAVGGG
jgi:sulfur carrier protein